MMTFALSLIGYLASLFMITVMVFAAVMWAFPAPGTSDHRVAVDISAQHHSPRGQHHSPRHSVHTVTRRLAERAIAQE